jgi:hypothetical protein
MSDTVSNEAFTEQGDIGGGGSGSGFSVTNLTDASSLTPQQARDQLDILNAQLSMNARHAYFVKEHPQHNAVVAHAARLREIATPAGDAPGEHAGGGRTPAADNPAPTVQTRKAASLSPEEAWAKILFIRTEMSGNANHPLLNKMAPGHDAAAQELAALYEAAYPESSSNADTAPPLTISKTEALHLANNHINWNKVTFEGTELSPADIHASQVVVSDTVEVLGLDKPEAGELVTRLNYALRTKIDESKALAILHREFGEAGTRDLLKDAKDVVAYLEQHGIRARDALSASEAGNDPSLIKYLAKLAPKIRARPVSRRM